ncbi:MAG: hypothetical protein Kow0089_24320 [Desulfobulbaceae bacterium]
MSIIRETKWALLELFPEQKETEPAAEAAAWARAREPEAEAGEEAEPTSPPEGGEETGSDVELERMEAEMSSLEAGEPEAGEEEEVAEPAAPETYDPEVHEVPLSDVPEGPRPDGVLVVDYRARGIHIDVQCSPGLVKETARILDEAGFHLEAVSGVDWIKEEQMEVVYDYNRTDGRFCRVAVRTRVPRSEPAVPSVSDIFPGANWHERETHEFFGIDFEGHPYLVPLLLPEDAAFHPLRKDFTP